MLRLINVQFTTVKRQRKIPVFPYRGYVEVEMAYGDIVDTEKEETVFTRFGIDNKEWIEAFKSGNSETRTKLTDFTNDERIQSLVQLPEELRFPEYVILSFEFKFP